VALALIAIVAGMLFRRRRRRGVVGPPPKEMAANEGSHDGGTPFKPFASELYGQQPPVEADGRSRPVELPAS
jgi:hypothetical protein